MDMTTLITQMLVLTIVMAIGFLARRTQVMDAGFSGSCPACFCASPFPP
ncbi:MAG: hypothetical protein V8T10_10630 [Merdibacter sp.]